MAAFTVAMGRFELVLLPHRPLNLAFAIGYREWVLGLSCERQIGPTSETFWGFSYTAFYSQERVDQASD